MTQPGDTITHHKDAVLQHLEDHPLPGNFRDLFGFAYHLFAELSGEGEIGLAIDRAAQDSLHVQWDQDQAPIQEIREAFGEGRPLSPHVLDKGPIETNSVLDRLRRYLAKEIRRLARLNSEVDSPASICDVSNRSLQKWVQL